MAITTFRVKIGERWYTLQLGDLTSSPVEVTVEGETFYVELEGLAPPPPPPPRRGRPSTKEGIAAAPPHNHSGPTPTSGAVLRSPMPGRVISIMVRPGDRVSAGDEVCVVEAMKMEQSIQATQDGVVKTVHVQLMDSVNANDALIELE